MLAAGVGGPHQLGESGRFLAVVRVGVLSVAMGLLEELRLRGVDRGQLWSRGWFLGRSCGLWGRGLGPARVLPVGHRERGDIFAFERGGAASVALLPETARGSGPPGALGPVFVR